MARYLIYTEDGVLIDDKAKKRFKVAKMALKTIYAELQAAKSPFIEVMARISVQERVIESFQWPFYLSSTTYSRPASEFWILVPGETRFDGPFDSALPGRTQKKYPLLIIKVLSDRIKAEKLLLESLKTKLHDVKTSENVLVSKYEAIYHEYELASWGVTPGDQYV